MGAVKITTLVDNLMGGCKDSIAEHGLFPCVEAGHTRTLFNSGAGAHTFEGGQKIKIWPDKIDSAVCSYGHYDHGGGYRRFVENGLQCLLVTGKGFFMGKYAISSIRSAHLGSGFDREFLTRNHVTHIECHGLTPPTPGCWAMDDIWRTYESESILSRFVLREQDTWVQDEFRDEICLITEGQRELAMIVGCSYPGTLNILTMVKEHFLQPIKAVIGGTHLVEVDETRTRQTVEIIKDMGIRLLGFNHCSEELFRNMMKQEETLSTVYLGAGDCLFPAQGYPQWTRKLMFLVILKAIGSAAQAALPMASNKRVTLIQFFR